MTEKLTRMEKQADGIISFLSSKEYNNRKGVTERKVADFVGMSQSKYRRLMIKLGIKSDKGITKELTPIQQRELLMENVSAKTFDALVGMKRMFNDGKEFKGQTKSKLFNGYQRPKFKNGYDTKKKGIEKINELGAKKSSLEIKMTDEANNGNVDKYKELLEEHRKVQEKYNKLYKEAKEKGWM